MRFLFAVSLVFSLFLGVFCQDVPFSLDGAIEGATAADASFNTGGTISVNGWTVKIPKNLQVGFPAAWVPWKDFVANKASYLGYEVSVVGNVLPNGAGAIAGQVYISQFFTEASQGFITQVNNDGSMQIANGPIIRINDPNAVYSAGYTGNPFFTADDENPSVSSFSGFPMCVPRNSTDPLCPQSQRPTITGTSKQGNLQAPNSKVMAPFVVGDYVEYSGIKIGGEVICYTIVATNIQITTTGVPSYIRMEDAIIGVFTADPNAEEADTKYIGYVSDTAASPVSIFAIDVDPCTGQTTDRQIASAAISAGDVRNKFNFRMKQPSGAKYTREYRITAANGVSTTTNGIKAGQYVQPVTEWIQPELAVPGLGPIPNDFSGFQHLTQGLGPDDDGNIWGPLNPFPQSGVTTFNIGSCPPVSPPTSTSTTSTSTSTTTAPTATDTVRVTSATWQSKGGGTLAVTCTSSNTNNAAVSMVFDYVVAGTTFFNVAMTPSSPGVWTFSNVKIKQPSTVTCKSKLGGQATLAVTQI